MQSPVIYLDYNATTPVDPRVVETMLPYFTEKFGNPASVTHAYGWQAKEAVENARQQVASLVNASPEEIVFTSGATEAVNMALKGIAERYAGKGNHIITVKTEHKAVLDTCKYLEERGLEVTYLSVSREGIIDLDELKRSITDKTILVCIMLANNETGTIQPVREVGAICREKNILFMSDATQAIGKMRVDVQEEMIDILCFSSHKVYGPKGVGAVYMRRRDPRVSIVPQMHGGGHENGSRSGTLNVPGIVGFGKACAIAENETWDDSVRISALRTRLEHVFTDHEGVHINGSVRNRLPNTSNLSFGNITSEKFIREMRMIAVSTGSACSSAVIQPSHVLKAMGVPDKEAFSSIRISLGRFTTSEEIERVIAESRKLFA